MPALMSTTPSLCVAVRGHGAAGVCSEGVVAGLRIRGLQGICGCVAGAISEVSGARV